MSAKHNLKNTRILIIDEDSYMANIIKSVLEAFKVSAVILARSNEDGLNLLKKKKFDCVLVDNMMSENNGIKLAQLIRKSISDNIQETPIILCTALTSMDTIVQARDAGVTEILTKPVSPDQILQKLLSAIFNPREFIVSENFLGPDRRRRMRPESSHENRRSSDTESPSDTATDKSPEANNEPATDQTTESPQDGQ